MKTLFEFHDSREMLATICQQMRERQGVSWRYMSKKAQLGAPNFLQQVIAGTRRLNPSHIEKLISYFRWSDDEASYFRCLVQFEYASDAESKNQAFRAMLGIRGFQKVATIERDHFEYFAHWYNPVVRELVGHIPAQVAAPEWIREKLVPQIGIEEIRKSLDLLQRMGMIWKLKGKWKQREAVISTPSQGRSLMLGNYHREILSMAQESIERFSSHQRELLTICLTLSPHQEEELRQRMENFWKEVLDWSKDQNSEGFQVFQFGMQFFPWTRSINRVG